MNVNKICAGLVLLAACQTSQAASAIYDCVGPICVNGKENFSQFKKKWKAYASPKLKREPASYPSLCLWDKENGISYVFYFIGEYGTTDEPISNTKLGEITIAKSAVCKKENVTQFPKSLDNEISHWIGRSKRELIERLGNPQRIDKENEIDVEISDLKNIVKENYLYFLDEKKELLFNSFGIDSNGKIVEILISEIP